MRRLAALFSLLGLVVAPSAGATSIGRVTLPQMAGNADVVFVGVFESAEPTSLGGGRGVRYRLRAEWFLRGGRAETVHLSVPDVPGVQLGLELGQRYLVFAERRRFGRAREERLTASGYYQGVYELLGEARARNDANGVVDLSGLPADLRREARVRVSLVHVVNDRTFSYGHEGAVYFVSLDRGRTRAARVAGFLENVERFRVQQGTYTVKSGTHVCQYRVPCLQVDFDDDRAIHRCSARVRLRWPHKTIRVVARAGARCRILVD